MNLINKKSKKKEMNRAVSYVVYDFPPGVLVDIENPAAIRAVTRSNSVALQGDFYGHTIVVTALDRLQNESLPSVIHLQ